MTGRGWMTTTSMQKIALLAGISLAAAGCKPTGGAGDAIAKLTELKDKMCACKDQACTGRVSEEMTQWGQEVAKAGGDQEARRSPEDMKQMRQVTQDLIRCEAKIVADAAHAATGTAGTAMGGGSAGSASAAGSGGGSAGPGSGTARP